MSWLKGYEYILLHFLIFNGVYRADYGKEFSKYKKIVEKSVTKLRLVRYISAGIEWLRKLHLQKKTERR